MSMTLYAHVYEWNEPTVEHDGPAPGEIKVKIDSERGDDLVVWMTAAQATVIARRILELTEPAALETGEEEVAIRYAEEHAMEVVA